RKLWFRFLAIATVFLVVFAACATDPDASPAGDPTAPPIPVDFPFPVGGPTGTTFVPPTAPSPTQVPVNPPQEPSPDQGSIVPKGHALVQAFFVADSTTAQPRPRFVERPDVATNAIREVLRGPTAHERADGVTTAIPTGTTLNSVEIDDRIATVDLSANFESGGGITNISSRLAQVVYTLTQFSTVDEVVFELDGKPVTQFSGEGIDLRDPVDRSDYATILPIDSGDFVIPSWDSVDLADLEGGDHASTAIVVLVDADDVLNVRVAPGTDSTIVGTLEPGTRVTRTGDTAKVGTATWAEVQTPLGDHWVNGHFLAAEVRAPDFQQDVRVQEVVDDLARILDTGDDLREVVSQRGLTVIHHGDPVRYSFSAVSTLVDSTTERQWGVPDGVNPGPPATFVQAVGDSFLAVYDDPETTVERDEWHDTNLPDSANPIPFPLRAFHHVGLHSPGENPPVDSVNWYVSLDYEDFEPRIVALTIELWSP
ncbi:MAG: GerMN domain-containing protein, partial [Acidimicrobiia bacterium]|nr:GerMN domain-containing protein [Acidimicrobiia bacterium]